MLTAQDVSYDEARNLHTKWQKHQAFMAELAANKDWLDKVDKVTNMARGTDDDPFELLLRRSWTQYRQKGLTPEHSFFQMLSLPKWKVRTWG